MRGSRAQPAASGLKHSSAWRDRLAIYALPALATALLLAVWEALVRFLNVPGWLLPTPSQVLATLIDQRVLLAHHTAATLLESSLGFGLTLLVGFGLGLLIDATPLLRRAIMPLLVASQTLPLVAIAPLLVIIFGFGLTPKVLVVALVTFFPIVVSVADGLLSATRDQLDLMHALAATRRQTLWLLRLPAALPSIFSGLKIAITYSIVGAIYAEWVGAQAGLGIYIARSTRAYRPDQVLAAVVVTAVITFVLFGLVALLERRMITWRPPTRR